MASHVHVLEIGALGQRRLWLDAAHEGLEKEDTCKRSGLSASVARLK